MKILKNTTLLISALFLFLHSCVSLDYIKGSDKITETTYNFNEFSAIHISHSFNVDLIQSNEYKIIIKHNDNLKEYLRVNKNNNTLSIGLQEDNLYRNTTLDATIYLPSINRIKASGASSIKTPNINGNTLEIVLSGASKLVGKLELLNNLNITASVASNIDLEGSVENANLDFSGATKLKSKNLIVKNNLNIDSTGASSIKLTADGTIHLELSGASIFKYAGNGIITKRDISGSSLVKKL